MDRSVLLAERDRGVKEFGGVWESGGVRESEGVRACSLSGVAGNCLWKM